MLKQISPAVTASGTWVAVFYNETENNRVPIACWGLHKNMYTTTVVGIIPDPRDPTKLVYADEVPNFHSYRCVDP